jgi:hypothetical protein
MLNTSEDRVSHENVKKLGETVRLDENWTIVAKNEDKDEEGWVEEI